MNRIEWSREEKKKLDWLNLLKPIGLILFLLIKHRSWLERIKQGKKDRRLLFIISSHKCVFVDINLFLSMTKEGGREREEKRKRNIGWTMIKSFSHILNVIT